MKEYIIIDSEGTAHNYEASDMPMAFIVHQQLTGDRDPQAIMQALTPRQLSSAAE